MKTRTLAIFLPLLASPLLGAPPESPPNSYQKIWEGPDILSIEEMAAGFFEDLRSDLAENLPPEDPFHPKNYLRDRDGLKPGEVHETISLALKPLTPFQPTIDYGCGALQKANGPDEILRVLEAVDASDVAVRRQEGSFLLQQLSPPTRAALRKALFERRKHTAVGRQDWKKLRDTAPEALEIYRSASCGDQ